MRWIKAEDGQNYIAPMHFGGEFRSKIDESIEGNLHLQLNISHIQPNGGCKSHAFPPYMKNVVYYLLEGRLEITTESRSFQMNQGDCVFWDAGESRSMLNKYDTVAKLLVVILK